MTYKLPSVSEELNAKVDRWYARNEERDARYAGAKYVDRLVRRYMKHNPVLLVPIGRVPEEVGVHLTYAILTTLRKLEKQAKREGKKLPEVTAETFESFQKGLRTGDQRSSLEASASYVQDNEPLYRSIVKRCESLPRMLRQHVQYPSIYTLMLLENQGNADELKQMLGHSRKT